MTDNMPRAPGTAALCCAKETQPRARRVLMSGALKEPVLARASQRCGVDHAFEKPESLDAWAALLPAALPDPARR